MDTVHCDFAQILIVHCYQHTNIFARVGAEPVPLVLAFPCVWKFDRADVRCVFAVNSGQNNLGVIFKPRSNKLPISRPVIFRIRRRVNANKSSASMNVLFKCLLLLCV